MLKKIRKPSLNKGGFGLKKLFAYLFVAFICFILVLFMPLTGPLTGGGGAPAHIGKQSVSLREYSLAVENLKSARQDRLEKASPKEFARLEKALRRQALHQLIDIYVIEGGAEKEGFFISDPALQDEIQSMRAFQEEGRFIYSLYKKILQNQNIRTNDFEKSRRRILLAKNFYGRFSFAAQTTAMEKEKSRNPFTAEARFAVLPKKLSETEEARLLSFLKTGKKDSAIAKLLKSLSWKSVKPFTPSYQKLFLFEGSAPLLKAVLSRLPKTGFAPYIVEDAGKRYIAEVTGFQKTSAAKTVSSNTEQDSLRLLRNYETPERLFESWLKERKKAVRIKINPQYLQTP